MLRCVFLCLIFLYSNSLYAVKCESSFLLHWVSASSFGVSQESDIKAFLDYYYRDVKKLTKPYDQMIPYLSGVVYEKILIEALSQLGIKIEDPEFSSLTDSQISLAMASVFKDAFYRKVSNRGWTPRKSMSSEVRLKYKEIANDPSDRFERGHPPLRTAVNQAKRLVAIKYGLSWPLIRSYERISNIAIDFFAFDEEEGLFLLRDFFRINLNFYLDHLNQPKNDLRQLEIQRMALREERFSLGPFTPISVTNRGSSQPQLYGAENLGLSPVSERIQTESPKRKITVFLHGFRHAAVIELVDEHFQNEIDELISPKGVRIHEQEVTDWDSYMMGMATRTLNLLTMGSILIERRRVIGYLYDKIDSPGLKAAVIERLDETEIELEEKWSLAVKTLSSDFAELMREFDLLEGSGDSALDHKLKELEELKRRVEDLGYL